MDNCPIEHTLTPIVVIIGGFMNSVSVRLRQDLVDAARTAARAEFRTMQGQIEYWALLGRTAQDNPGLPISFIAESLISMAEPKDEAAEFVPRSKKAR